jgi:hypothetical protein
VPNTSERVQVTVGPEIEHDHPVPAAAVGVNPAGNGSVTVTADPFVAVSPVLVTVSVKLPGPPRRNVEAFDVLSIARLGPAIVFIVTEPVPGVVSPPPLAVAEFVMDGGASEAISTDTEIPG